MSDQEYLHYVHQARIFAESLSWNVVAERYIRLYDEIAYGKRN